MGTDGPKVRDFTATEQSLSVTVEASSVSEISRVVALTLDWKSVPSELVISTLAGITQRMMVLGSDTYL